MDAQILNEGYYVHELINKKLRVLDKASLMDIIDDVIHRRIFIKFIQKIHESDNKTEAMKLLNRYILCHKILNNQENFENKKTFKKLIELCPSILWVQKIENLNNNGKDEMNFEYVMEKLKWETVTELICHDDYKKFLTAIRKKSKLIVEILKESYEIYYF